MRRMDRRAKAGSNNPGTEVYIRGEKEGRRVWGRSGEEREEGVEGSKGEQKSKKTTKNNAAVLAGKEKTST